MHELGWVIAVRTAVVAALLLSVGLSACSGRLYGGKPFFSPDSAYVCGGEREFDGARFAGFRLGVTTKAEALTHLGEPLWWMSSAAGASLLGYDYYVKRPPSASSRTPSLSNWSSIREAPWSMSRIPARERNSSATTAGMRRCWSKAI
ncbi:MAG TPA: hypothetical protein VHZ29_10460 [Rhizomicrobium sp.]|nr:hypothetical protein [Rhizomicrobium sp.]